MFQEVKDKQEDHSDDINKSDLRGIEVSKQFNAFQSQLGSMQSQIATFSEDITGKDKHFTQNTRRFFPVTCRKTRSYA